VKESIFFLNKSFIALFSNTYRKRVKNCIFSLVQAIMPRYKIEATKQKENKK